MKNFKWLIILSLLGFSIITAEDAKENNEASLKNQQQKEENSAVEKQNLQKTDAESKNEEKINFISTGLKLDLTVPTADIDTTWGFHGELRYILPWLNPIFSFGVEAGYYKFSGSGKKVDDDYGVYNFDWEIKAIPLYIGPEAEIKSSIPGLYFFVNGGFALVFADGTGNGIEGKNSESDTAYGYFLGGGAFLKFGSFGGITGEFRHTAVYVDFGNSEFGSSTGNIGGDSFLLGYKYIY